MEFTTSMVTLTTQVPLSCAVSDEFLVMHFRCKEGRDSLEDNSLRTAIDPVVVYGRPFTICQGYLATAGPGEAEEWAWHSEMAMSGRDVVLQYGGSLQCIRVGDDGVPQNPWPRIRIQLPPRAVLWESGHERPVLCGRTLWL